MAATKLVLWDVDHTLIRTNGVGRQAFAQAFRQVTGRVMEEQSNVSGRTEPVIFKETLALHGIEPTPDAFERFAAALDAGYVEHVEQLSRQGEAMPGAEAALRTLAQDADVVQSVLTGNVKPVAVTKLATFGLDRWVDFEVGGYGSDDSVRSRLVDVARERAAGRYGGSFAREATILIGDTPADVEAGLTAGAKVIGVASGKSSRDELVAAGAEVVLDSLRELEELMGQVQTHGNRDR